MALSFNSPTPRRLRRPNHPKPIPFRVFHLNSFSLISKQGKGQEEGRGRGRSGQGRAGQGRQAGESGPAEISHTPGKAPGCWNRPAWGARGPILKGGKMPNARRGI